MEQRKYTAHGAAKKLYKNNLKKVIQQIKFRPMICWLVKVNSVWKTKFHTLLKIELNLKVFGWIKGNKC